MADNTATSHQDDNAAPEPDQGKKASSRQDNDLAAAVIRKKIESIYSKEPDAKEEAVKAETTTHRSKHQQYMHELTKSGKSLADIQTAWHEYYVALPDEQKHEVWQEFYRVHEQDSARHSGAHNSTQQGKSQADESQADSKQDKSQAAQTDSRSVGEVKQQLLKRVSAKGKLKPRHHLQSLLFGVGMGLLVMMVMLFGFFNERFIAPFITPSKEVSNTPIIVDPASAPIDSEPKIIIPKINVEVPVVYGETSIAEEDIQRALEDGVVHYPTTPEPGEEGNVAIVGHSSNNILNSGRYKFAFVLLNRLENDDTIIINKDGERYVYRVYESEIVEPTDVSVLGPTDRPATLTLITCDPPGTSINRLVIRAEQVTPDPQTNVASTATEPEQTAQLVPGAAPTLWDRIKNWLIGLG